MQLITAALFLAASALAAPSEKRTDHETCTFGTYRCTHPNTGIEICNVANEWELVGDCPKDTACKNLDMGGYELPFCTDTVKVEARNGRGPSPGEKCEKAGQYTKLMTWLGFSGTSVDGSRSVLASFLVAPLMMAW
ncbi:hypothetical protein N0V88_007728 [Collariella sp. IMI 366227]|nr:hypothetical protein N0V88_007728 [Collariella sp. IMI 366227]